MGAWVLPSCHKELYWGQGTAELAVSKQLLSDHLPLILSLLKDKYEKCAHWWMY